MVHLHSGIDRETDLTFLQHTPTLQLAATDIAGFDDTAAIIANLDLVISVDTSIAHLTGALGKPAWILLLHATMGAGLALAARAR